MRTVKPSRSARVLDSLIASRAVGWTGVKPIVFIVPIKLPPEGRVAFQSPPVQNARLISSFMISFVPP